MPAPLSGTLQQILRHDSPMDAYRNSLDAATAETDLHAEDDLSVYHQVQTRATSWLDVLGAVTSAAETTLATLHETVQHGNATSQSEAATVAAVMDTLQQRRLVAVEADPALVTIARRAKLERRGQSQHGDTGTLMQHVRVLAAPSVPSDDAIEAFLQQLAPAEQAWLLARAPRLPQPTAPVNAHGAVDTSRCADVAMTRNPVATLSDPPPMNEADQVAPVHAQQKAAPPAEAKNKAPSSPHPFELLEQAHAQQQAGAASDPPIMTFKAYHDDVTDNHDGESDGEQTGQSGVYITPYEFDTTAATRTTTEAAPGGQPLFEVDWAPPPPPVTHHAGSLSSSSSSMQPDPQPAPNQPVVEVTPQPEAETMAERSDFSTFSDARLQNMRAYAMRDTAMAFRVVDGARPASANDTTNSTTETPATTTATTSHTPATKSRDATEATTSASTHPTAAAVTVAVNPAGASASAPPQVLPEVLEATRLALAVREVLMAEQAYTQAAADAATLVGETARVESCAAAARDRDVMEQMQVMLLEAESLLSTVQNVQLHSWREALASAATNPTNVITSPRFALCCAACRANFTKTVVRTTCRRCGQFFCPDCVREYGIGPDVSCADERGESHYVSLGWEPICGACYRNCAAYALQVLESSQPRLLTYDAHATGGSTGGAAAAPSIITSAEGEQVAVDQLRRGAASGVPLKHLILSGIASNAALPSVARGGGGDGSLAADGFPPFYVYVAGDRSMTMADRVGHQYIKSTGTWKSALKGTGTMASNLFGRMKRTLGSYYRGTTTSTVNNSGVTTANAARHNS